MIFSLYTFNQFLVTVLYNIQLVDQLIHNTSLTFIKCVNDFQKVSNQKELQAGQTRNCKKTIIIMEDSHHEVWE